MADPSLHLSCLFAPLLHPLAMRPSHRVDLKKLYTDSLTATTMFIPRGTVARPRTLVADQHNLPRYIVPSGTMSRVLLLPIGTRYSDFFISSIEMVSPLVVRLDDTHVLNVSQGYHYLSRSCGLALFCHAHTYSLEVTIFKGSLCV